MAVKIQHLRSSTASKRPTSAALLDGELSINTNAGTPGVFFENASGGIIKVGPAEVGSSAPNSTPAAGGSSGNTTGEFWLDTSNTGGNSAQALKIFDGSAWDYIGSVTIGSTSIELGSAGSTTLAGLTSVTSTGIIATSSLDLQNQADLRFYEDTGNGTNYVGFQAPANIAANVLWTLPAADGTADQVLSTNGSGVLSWSEARTNDISQGDSSVTVTDTGSNGTIAFNTDNSNRWNINNSGHLVPGADSTYDIGASGNEVNHIYVDSLTVQTSGVFNGDVDLGNATTDSITFTGRVDSDLLPLTTNSHKLGQTGLVWSEVHGTSLYGSVQEVTVLKSVAGDSGSAVATAQSVTISGGTGLSSTASGTTLTINLDNTGVTASTYGSATAIPVLTINAQGQITSASTQSISTTLGTAGDSGTGSIALATQSLTISGGTGLTSTASNQSVTINLDNTAVTPGAYGGAGTVGTFTVDAQGRLTAAANATISITHSQVSDFDTGVRANRLDQLAAPTAPVSLNSQRITDLADPKLPQDAATKAYADSIAQSLNVHGAADYATTGAVSYAYASGGTALTITTITGTDTITFSANHNLAINSQIRTGTTTTGTGLTANTTYYVTATPALNQVKVSSTYGGSNAVLTNGTGLSIGVTGDPGVGATLSGTPDALDSSGTLTTGLRILVKDHTTAAYNGVYTVTTVGTGSNGVWTRSTDFDNGPTGEITTGDYIFVAKGTTNGGNGFVQTSTPPIRMGIDGAGYGSFSGDSITFVQFSGAGQITAGNGLSKTGNTLDVNVDNTTLDIVADNLQIKSTYVGQSSITTLGTITSGTWNGTAIGLSYGGTGQDNTNVTRYHAFMAPNNANGNASFREILTSDIAPVTGGSFDAGSY